MTFTNAHANAYNLLLFHNIDFATVGDAAGLQNSVGAGNLYISLHSSDPGVGGSQTTNEVTVGNWDTYARKPLARAAGAGGWTHTAASTPAASKMANTDLVAWTAKGNGGTATVLWAGIGTEASGAGVLLYRCPLALETPKPFTVTDLTNDDVVCASHGYATDDKVVFIDVEGSVLPDVMVEGTEYFVQATGAVTNVSFRVGTGSGTGVLNFTTRGAGMVAKVASKTLTQGDIFEIAAGAIAVYLK